MKQPTTTLKWHPGGSQGASGFELENGSSYLMAVPVCHTPAMKLRVAPKDREHQWWDIQGVNVSWDEDRPLTLQVDGDYWGWEWDSVEWFVPMSEVDLPVPEEPTA